MYGGECMYVCDVCSVYASVTYVVFQVCSIMYVVFVAVFVVVFVFVFL